MNDLDWGQLATVGAFSFLQAFTSTIGILAIGFFISLGLISMKSPKRRRLLAFAISLPSFVPTLFVITSYLNWLHFFGLDISGGMLSVIFIHILISSGFIGALLSEQLGAGMDGAIQLAQVEGASRLKTWWAILQSSQTLMVSLGMGVFAICFTSFSVPLLMGGSSILSFEILAFRYMAGSGSWGLAASISGLQFLIFTVLAFYFAKDLDARRLTNGDVGSNQWLGHSGFLILGLGLTLIALLGSTIKLSQAFIEFDVISNKLPLLVLSSLLVAFAVGLFSLGLYLFANYFYLDIGFRRTINSLGIISSVFLGLAFYLLPIPVFLKLVFGISILFFPTVHRLLGRSKSDMVIEHLQIAQILGAGPIQRFTKIALPLLLPTGFQIAGVASFWAAGEYAFSSVVSGEITNLALLARNLLGGYRIELATIVVWSSVLIGALCFSFFWSLSYVYRQKLFS